MGLIEFIVGIISGIIGLVVGFIGLVVGLVGGLIGFEIPLVTRLNESHEELRTNIAAVMEKDYFGALFGGLFFAFFALPHLGLTYTPLVLASINFLVASLLLWFFFRLTTRKKTLVTSFALCIPYISISFESFIMLLSTGKCGLPISPIPIDFPSSQSFAARSIPFFIIEIAWFLPNFSLSLIKSTG